MRWVAIGLAAIVGCERQPHAVLDTIATTAVSEIKAQNGIVLLYDATCKVVAATVQTLNRLDSIPGVVVVAVAVPFIPGGKEWIEAFRATGMTFPIHSPVPFWREIAVQYGVSPPALVVIRYGRVVAVFTADAKGSATALLPLFGLRAEGES